MSLFCSRHLSSNFGRRFNISLRRSINPFKAIVKFFTPGPLPKPKTAEEKARLNGLRFKQFVILPSLFLGEFQLPGNCFIIRY